MYATKYIVPFISLKGTNYEVEIQTEGYTGVVKELVGSATPFTVKIDDNDFLYSPCRFSTASLRLVGDDYLQELFSTNYQQYRIVLKSGTNVVWVGFVSPEVYTQDYANIPFELEVQCSSAMSTLEYLDYKKVGEACTFVSIFDVLKQCVKSANADYSNIFVPHVYASSEAAYAANENVFEKMTISEQNFFDEDGKALKLKEVLEEVCKFLGWTCVDSFGSLYFVDVDYNGDYLAYSGDFSSVTTRSFGAMNVQQIGFAGGDQTLDILGGYSKASVKASNYAAGDLSPKEEYDNLDNIGEIIQTEEDIVVDKKKVTSVSVKKIMRSRTYKMHHYADDGNLNTTGVYVPPAEVSEGVHQTETTANKLLGAYPIQVDNYKKVAAEGGGFKPDITNYSWEDLIQLRLVGVEQWREKVANITNTYTTYIQQQPILTYEDDRAGIYVDGALSFNMSIQVCSSVNMHYKTPDKPNISASDYNDPKFAVVLSIGDYYYYEGNGLPSGWSKGKRESTIGGIYESFMLQFDKNAVLEGNFVKNIGNKTLEMPYDGLDGKIIELPLSASDTIPSGKLKIEIYSPVMLRASIYAIKGYFIKDFKIGHKKTTLSKAEKNSDRIYENVVNDKYINECDSIELKINSYNNDDISFSKVLLSGKYLTDNLYCKIANKLIRPEEQLIRRIINQYSATKIKLKQVLIYSDAITPVTRLSDNYTVNRVYMVSGGEIDYAGDKFDLNMIEIV